MVYYTSPPLLRHLVVDALGVTVLVVAPSVRVQRRSPRLRRRLRSPVRHWEEMDPFFYQQLHRLIEETDPILAPIHHLHI